MVPCCSGYCYCTTSFNNAWFQVLHRFKSCLQPIPYSQQWESLTVVPAEKMAKRLLLVTHTTKTIHQWRQLPISSKTKNFFKEKIIAFSTLFLKETIIFSWSILIVKSFFLLKKIPTILGTPISIWRKTPYLLSTVSFLTFDIPIKT